MHHGLLCQQLAVVLKLVDYVLGMQQLGTFVDVGLFAPLGFEQTEEAAALLVVIPPDAILEILEDLPNRNYSKQVFQMLGLS